MERRKIEARKEKILDIIIRRYIESAEPISSKIVSDQMEISSATARIIMSELECSGFISQPHTSAGRIPTEKGYRYYVNFLMEPEDISNEEKGNIEAIYRMKREPLEDVIEESSHILCSISSLAAVAMFPRVDENKLYFEGAHHILEQPEFKDSEAMMSIFKALEERRALLEIFEQDMAGEGPKVRIGSENNASTLRQCSTIIASYRIGENAAGAVGVLGPTRMAYKKLVSVVNYVAGTISNFFKDVYMQP